MSSDGGNRKRQDDVEGADFSDDGMNQNEINKRRKLLNIIRCKRYRDKKKKTSDALVSSQIYKDRTITVEEEEKIKRRKEYDKQKSKRYRDKKRANNLIHLHKDQSSKTVATPGFPESSGVDEVKSENPASSVWVKAEKPGYPIFGGTSTTQDSVLCNDSNDRWWHSDTNDNGVNSTNEGARKKKKDKKTVNSSPAAAQSPAAQVAAVETECRRELHKMQMKVTNLQVANEEHKSRILRLEEELQRTKIEYYKRKMQFYDRETGGRESE